MAFEGKTRTPKTDKAIDRFVKAHQRMREGEEIRRVAKAERAAAGAEALEGVSLRELGEAIGVTPERVRQMIKEGAT